MIDLFVNIHHNSTYQSRVNMSFWENNKGSIKSGGMSLLKGAGKATATVSKAGYGAYKNHQANKKNALAESEEVEQQTAPIPAASYRDRSVFSRIILQKHNLSPTYLLKLYIFYRLIIVLAVCTT